MCQVKSQEIHYVQYESSISSGKKVMAKGKVFSEKGQTSRSRSRGQQLWYHVEGLITRNTYVQYESPISSGKKVMAKDKVFQKKVKLQGQGHEV